MTWTVRVGVPRPGGSSAKSWRGQRRGPIMWFYLSNGVGAKKWQSSVPTPYLIGTDTTLIFPEELVWSSEDCAPIALQNKRLATDCRAACAERGWNYAEVVVRPKKSERRPPQFTERDEQDLRDAADATFSEIAHDMGRAHYGDVVDCLFSQWDLGMRDCSLNMLPAWDAMVARDAERSELWEHANEIRRRGDLAEDVLYAFMRYNDPGHAWAVATVTQHLKTRSDKKGFLC